MQADGNVNEAESEAQQGPGVHNRIDANVEAAVRFHREHLISALQVNPEPGQHDHVLLLNVLPCGHSV